MKILSLTTKNKDEVIDQAFKILHNGGLVIVPSDTVYGVSVDACNENAVQKLIHFKSRPPGKPISVFVGTMQKLQRFVETTPSQVAVLESLLPGPYTIVLPSLHKTSKLLESEQGTLGVRIPNNDFVNELVNNYETPLTATSANRAGQSPHYSVDALLNTLSDEKKAMIDLIIDAGKLPIRKPSTVVDMTKDTLSILREGDFGSLLQLQGETEEYDSKSEVDTKVIARNVIEKYYTRAKHKPLVFVFTGTLGAGKTVFVKSMATFLGVENVVSPTFVIYYDYDAHKDPVKKFIHADFYRLKDTEEFEHLGIEEFLTPGNVICIEWSEKSEVFLNKFIDAMSCVYINIEYTGESSRHITIQKNF